MTTHRVLLSTGASRSRRASDQDMSVAAVGPDRATLAVAGEVDASNADHLRLAVLDAASKHDGELSVDLAGVTFMDSSGIRGIADAAQALDAPAFGLVLCNVPPRLQRILEIAQCGRALKVRR